MTTFKLSSVVSGLSVIESLLTIYRYIPRILLFNVETLIRKHGVVYTVLLNFKIHLCGCVNIPFLISHFVFLFFLTRLVDGWSILICPSLPLPIKKSKYESCFF